jgi:Fe2+ transport system protein FeoA
MRATMLLAQAPHGRPLKITAVHGGEGVRRRLFALGFHRDDLIEVNAQGILRGPLLIKNLSSDSSVALGRGIAQKIEVEVLPDISAVSPDER